MMRHKSKRYNFLIKYKFFDLIVHNYKHIAFSEILRKMLTKDCDLEMNDNQKHVARILNMVSIDLSEDEKCK